MLKYLKLENVLKILTIFISLLALVTFFQGIGLFKKKPKIFIEFKNPVRVLNYQELKKNYENLSDSRLPHYITLLLENRIEEKKLEKFSRFSIFRKLVRDVIFYEELPYGINSQDYFNKLHPMGVALNDIENLKIKHPHDFFVDSYKVELGIKEKEQMGYDELLALPPYQLGVSLLSSFEFPLSISSINFPDIIKKLSRAIENNKSDVSANLPLEFRWNEIEFLYERGHYK